MPQTTSVAGALSGNRPNEVYSACIVIPTYNEATNIRALLDIIFSIDRAQPIGEKVSLHVLVVDDNSPDGTASIVEEYRQTNPMVHLHWREKKDGLGAAYIAGMKLALETLNPDVIIEMDADMSHNPADIYRLISGIKSGYDFVIGSRYVPGGKLPDNWGLNRKIISKVSNFVTKVILGVWLVKDCTGGFRAIRASILGKVSLSSLRVKGYAFQAVILDAAIRKGAKVTEIPITFSERNGGKSKMTMKDLVEGGFVLLNARFDRILKERRSIAMRHIGTHLPDFASGRDGRVKQW